MLEPACVCAWTTKAADEQENRLLIPFPKKKNPKHPRTEYSKQGEPLAQEQIEPQNQVSGVQKSDPLARVNTRSRIRRAHPLALARIAMRTG